LTVHDRFLPVSVFSAGFACNRNATRKPPRGIVPKQGRTIVAWKAETDGRRMGRHGTLWLAKVSAATALLAMIGVFAAPAGSGEAAKEPPARALHWFAHE
jgi:hypothetical protein